MGMERIHSSLKYDFSGRKRKPKKVTGEVYGKYQPPPFTEYKPAPSIAQERASETNRYPSFNPAPRKTGGDKRESPRYTGDYVIGIATLHKSNAVPVTNKKYATEISEMIK